MVAAYALETFMSALNAVQAMVNATFYCDRKVRPRSLSLSVFSRSRQVSQRSLICITFVAAMLFPGPGLWAKTYAVVVSGLGGNPEYQASFDQTATAFAEALDTLDRETDLIVTLDAKATRLDIIDAINSHSRLMQEASDETAAFVLILVGHGTADTQTWRFNNVGPDLTTEDLIAALNAVPTQQQLIVLAASASGATLDTLSQLGRVLVTATKSGGEINAVRFPAFLADAVQSEIADYDRNEILTIAEAYRFAQSRTTDYYEQQNLLASEHSRLRGDNASEMAIALLGSLKNAKDDPVVASLLDERLLLERAFKTLTRRKQEMDIDTYYEDLEQLLLSIARLQQSIDEASGWSDSDAES